MFRISKQKLDEGNVCPSYRCEESLRFIFNDLIGLICDFLIY